MHLNIASELVDASRYDEALWHYQHGLRFEAMADDTLGRLVHLHQRVCDWRAVDRLLPQLRHLVARALRASRRPVSRPALAPMHMLTLPFAASEMLGLARVHASALEAEAHGAGLLSFIHPHRPLPLLPPLGSLHIGLMSSDFKRHPVSILLAPVLSHLKRACPHLSLTLFALNPDPRDTWRRMLEAGVDRVEDLSALGDMDAAARVNDARVHVLIDLNGLYSRGARPKLLAARPAPLQATHLGYGASTGASFIDLVLADRVALPPVRASSRAFDEKLLLLPVSHLPSGHATLFPEMLAAAPPRCCGGDAHVSAPTAPTERLAHGRRDGDAHLAAERSGRVGASAVGSSAGSSQADTPLPAGQCRRSARRQLGLLRPSLGGGVGRRPYIFAYFGQHLKVDGSVFGAWMRLLRRVPNSLLALLEWPDSAHRLRAQAAAAGVRSSRLVFIRRLPQGDHLCAFRLADLALDAPSYNSGATGVDVLYSGVALLALAGGVPGQCESTSSGTPRCASTIFQRNAISLTAAAAQPHMQAHSWPEYEDFGLGGARRKQTQGALRRRAEAARHWAPAFDARRWAAGFGRAVSIAWETHRTGAVMHTVVIERYPQTAMEGRGRERENCTGCF